MNTNCEPDGREKKRNEDKITKKATSLQLNDNSSIVDYNDKQRIRIEKSSRNDGFGFSFLSNVAFLASLLFRGCGENEKISQERSECYIDRKAELFKCSAEFRLPGKRWITRLSARRA